MIKQHLYSREKVLKFRNILADYADIMVSLSSDNSTRLFNLMDIYNDIFNLEVVEKMKYKIGDRVRFGKNKTDVGTIVYVDEKNEYIPYRVKIDDGGVGFFHDEHIILEVDK